MSNLMCHDHDTPRVGWELIIRIADIAESIPVGCAADDIEISDSAKIGRSGAQQMRQISVERGSVTSEICEISTRGRQSSVRVC